MKYKTMLKQMLLTGILAVTVVAVACTKTTGSGQTGSTVTETPIPTVTATPTLTTEEQFDLYTEELFRSEIVGNTINLHYTLAYPENFGITEYEPTLGSFDIEGMQQSYDEMKQLKEELETFCYEELTAQQQLTYDIVMDYMETELMVEDLLFYTEVLGPVTGYQAQLPVVLAEYHFRTVQDIENYLALVAMVDELFEELMVFEQRKSEAGFFMPDYVADAIIDQCRQFIENPEENYMIAMFESEIQAVAGLSEEQKQEYSSKNRELIITELTTAYETLISGLEALKGTGTNEKGLCYYQDGKRYYEYLARSMTGSDKSVEQLLQETGTELNEMMTEMRNIILEDRDVVYRLESLAFCETEPQAILSDLIEKISEDFPAVPEVQYTIKQVHPSMQEHMSPAFYLLPPVDAMEQHVIYINDFQLKETSLYTTMAHEGFPGHLYQNVYTGSKNLPLTRNLFSFSGYSEGWATYAEYYSYRLGLEDEALADLMKLNDAIMLGIHAYVDMGIHYCGWTVEEIEAFLTQYGLGGAGVGQNMFEMIVAEPANYLSYFIGYMEMQNLREVAEQSWGDNYSLKKFHEAVLSLGPAPFYLLEERIRNYERINLN